MHSFSRQIVLLSVACSLLVAASVTKPLFAAITVQTAKGRVLTGKVDEQTDDQLLWIRQEDQQILLTTSVPWSTIVAASEDGENLPLDQLPTLLRARTTSEPSLGFSVQRVAYHAPADCQGTCQSRLVPRRTAQVRSLNVEAFLVNLDQDVEPDGLELIVSALDEHGLPVPVKGSLSVELWGERIHSHGSLVRYENLERWTQPVVPVDFSNGVVSYAFRFRTTQPEQDTGLHSDALVQVRLGVFGEGNFSASAPVQIRRFNPFRDRLQLTRGSRFLPNERTQEGRHQLPYRTPTRRTP